LLLSNICVVVYTFHKHNVYILRIFNREVMWLFNKKKKKHNNLTDLERELALQTRLENKALRDMQRKLKIKELMVQEAELDAELDELTPEQESLFGLGNEEMQLLNILQKSGVIKSFGNPQEQEAVTPHSSNPSEQTDSRSDLLSKLPKPFLNKLKAIPKEDLHKAIDEL
jgi:hypothetical protein